MTFSKLNVSVNGRLLVGICGIPASGKSTFANLITNRINDLYRSDGHDENVAICVGLDGWHLSRATLATFPNAEEAFARRGAHWTFSGVDYSRFVQSLRELPTVLAPSFSHEAKDPVADDIKVEENHKIVVIEGLYVFLSIEPWATAGALLDERWILDVDLQEAKARLVNRHVKTGVTSTMEEAIRRANENDLPSTL